MKTLVLFALILLLPLSFVLAGTSEKPPSATTRDVQDTYFGVTLKDSYRWMENGSNPEFIDWLKAQNGYTRDVLQALPGRQALLNRIHQLDDAGTIVYNVQWVGDLYFYYKIAPGDSIEK